MDEAAMNQDEGSLKSTPASASLDHALNVVLRMGLLTGRCGAAAFRVRKNMERAARSLSLPQTEFVVTPDAIYASARCGTEHRTQVVRMAEYGVNMWRLRALDQLSRRLQRTRDIASAEQLEVELRAIETQSLCYPRWLTVPVLGGACAAFCGVTGGTGLQMLAAFLGTSLGHTLRLQLIKRHFPLVTIVLLCSLTACVGAYFAALGLGSMGRALNVGQVLPDRAVLSSVLYLVPGVPLVTGLLDVAHGDCASGLSRAAHASFVLVCIGAGVLTFFALLGHGV